MQERFNLLLEVARRHPKTTVSLLSLLAGGASLLAIRLLHHKLITFPDVGGRYNAMNILSCKHPKNRGMTSKDIEIKTEDGLTLRGWYIQHPNPEKILVFYHENAGNIGGRLPFIEHLMKNIPVSVVIIAYRSFSESDGSNAPTEKQLMIDSRAIIKEGIRISEEEKLPLYVYGRSLGGALSIYTLSLPENRQKVKGLIIENTFTSIYDVAANIVPTALIFLRPLVWLMTSGSFNSLERIKKIHTPILMIKGAKDTLIPKSQMDALEQACIQQKIQHFCLVIPEGTHNDTWYQGGKTYLNAFSEFLNHRASL